MNPLDIAGLLKNYGAWGLSALLIVAVVKLWSDNKALTERVIVAIVENNKGTADIVAALNELRRSIDARGAAVGDLAHKDEILTERMKHGFRNVSAGMEALTGAIKELRDRPPRGRSS